MHAFKVLFLLAFSVIASASFSDDANFELIFRRANRFFDAFELSVTDKLQNIGLQITQVDELFGVYSTILSFPLLVREQLFHELMNISNTDDHIYESFLVFFNSTIGLELDNIQRQENAVGEHWIDAYIEKYASDLKDAITSSVKVSIDSVTLPKIQNPVARPGPKIPVYATESDSDDEFDEISAEITVSNTLEKSEIAEKENIQEEIEEIMKASSRPTSPKPSPDLAFEAMSILYYGIKSNHPLFPCALSFLEFVRERGIKIVDPQLLFSRKHAQMASNHGFHLGSSGFQEFCNYLSFNSVPITSPLYCGPFVSKSKKLEVKRSVLINLARDKMQGMMENFDTSEMILYIRSQHPDFEEEIVDFFVNHTKDEVSSFLLTLNLKVSLASRLETTIKDSCQQIFEIFALPVDPELNETILKSFMSIFQSPLALIKNYDAVEEWKSYYDENSPSFKPSREVGCDETSGSSSGRKSVKIVEDNNEVCLIERIADIEERYMREKENKSSPLRRMASIHGDLIDISNRPSSPFAVFEDKIRVVKHFDKSPSVLLPVYENDPDFDFISIHKAEPKRKFSSSEILDFPFMHPSEIIEHPDYIKDTGDYFLEHGDNACFMIEERLSTLKEGLTTFLDESFEEESVSQELMKIFESNLNSIFKP